MDGEELGKIICDAYYAGAELDSLWLEQAVSKATEERVTVESTIAWENLFFIIISSFLVYRKK